MAQDAQAMPACADFVKLYVQFQADLARFGDTQDPAAKVRMARFAVRVDNAWRQLPGDQQKIIVEALLLKRALPEDIGRLLKIFEGKVVKVC